MTSSFKVYHLLSFFIFSYIIFIIGNSQKTVDLWELDRGLKHVLVMPSSFVSYGREQCCRGEEG